MTAWTPKFALFVMKFMAAAGTPAPVIALPRLGERRILNGTGIARLVFASCHKVEIDAIQWGWQNLFVVNEYGA
jgi:hypothetical protein